MNKLFILFIHTFIFSCYINSMEQQQIELIPLPESYPFEEKKLILLELACNVHQYVKEEKNNNKAYVASCIISNVNRVNKALHNSLQEILKNPIKVHHIIEKLLYGNDALYDPSIYTKIQKIFPGTKTCYELSKQLYDNDLNPEKIQQLYDQGATLTYFSPTHKYDLLPYWLYNEKSTDKSIEAIWDKLLELGICSKKSIAHAMSYRKINCFKIALKHKVPIEQSCWFDAIRSTKSYYSPTEEYLNLLLEHATQDELNQGLQECFNVANTKPECAKYQPEIIQKFIDKNADLNIGLKYLVETLRYIPCLQTNNDFGKILMFLCNNKAFDKTALTHLKTIHTIFGSWIKAIEQNQDL